MPSTTIWPTLEDDRLVWICTGCGKPIDDNTGWIEADWRAAMRQEEEHEKHRFKSWQEAGEDVSVMRLGDVLGVANVPWLAWHEKCDPAPDADQYWIGVERVRTLRHVLHWTAHLADKTWVAETNWMEIVHRLGTPS